MSRYRHLLTPGWVGGVVLAALGVILARLVAPAAAGTLRPWLEAAGKLIALGGLFVIAAGVSRRVRGGSVI
jgi:hypothetical protein